MVHDIFHLTELDQHHLSAANGKRSRNFSPKRDSAQPISRQKGRQKGSRIGLNWSQNSFLDVRKQNQRHHISREGGADEKIRLESLDSRNAKLNKKFPWNKIFEPNFALEKSRTHRAVHMRGLVNNDNTPALVTIISHLSTEPLP